MQYRLYFTFAFLIPALTHGASMTNSFRGLQEEEIEDCWNESKTFKPTKDSTTKISCADVTADTSICTTSFKADEKCNACGNCVEDTNEDDPDDPVEIEDCWNESKTFKPTKDSTTKISCADVTTDTSICTASFKADKKCNACGNCVEDTNEDDPDDPVEVEDCWDESKRFKPTKGSTTKISCADVTTDTSICTTSWNAGKKCIACGNCVEDTTEDDPDDL